MIEIDKMSDLEYQEYCLKEYEKFFQLLNSNLENSKKKKTKYEFDGKKLNIYPTIRCLIIDGFKIPDNITIWNFNASAYFELRVLNYPEDTFANNLLLREISFRIGVDSNLKKLGKNTTLIGGNLSSMYNCLEDLSNLKMHSPMGTLNITKTNISQLPNELYVDNLNISYTKIKKIGNKTIVNSLNAYNSFLEEFPYDFQCLNLNISYTKIKKIPLSLKNNNNNDYLFILINGLLIENMIELFNNEEIICYTTSKENACCSFYGEISLQDIKNHCETYNCNLENGIYKKTGKKWNQNIERQQIDLTIKNIIIGDNAIKPIQKKLLLDNFEAISKKEIISYIKRDKIIFNYDLIKNKIISIYCYITKKTFKTTLF